MAIYLACDYRYAATGRVLIGKPEVLLGVPNPYYGDRLLRFVAGDFVASDMIYTGKLVRAEEGRALNLVHETGPRAEIEQMAWQRLLFLRDLAPDAFQESKRMRLGKFCADLREQMPSRIARQVEIWHGADAQARLRAGAERLKRRPTRRSLTRVSRHARGPIPPSRLGQKLNPKRDSPGLSGIKWDKWDVAHARRVVRAGHRVSHAGVVRA